MCLLGLYPPCKGLYLPFQCSHLCYKVLVARWLGQLWLLNLRGTCIRHFAIPNQLSTTCTQSASTGSKWYIHKSQKSTCSSRNQIVRAGSNSHCDWGKCVYVSCFLSESGNYNYRERNPLVNVLCCLLFVVRAGQPLRCAVPHSVVPPQSAGSAV